VNNIEELMRELMRSSVLLKRELYRRDEAAATSPEGVNGPTVEVHTCLVCERSAAGEGAQVRHKSNCALARLQRAQAALRSACPELFTAKPVAAPSASAAAQATPHAVVPAAAAPLSGACEHLSGGEDPATRSSVAGSSPTAWPSSPSRAAGRKNRLLAQKEPGALQMGSSMAGRIVAVPASRVRPRS
jgi:hypothetical protein